MSKLGNCFILLSVSIVISVGTLLAPTSSHAQSPLDPPMDLRGAFTSSWHDTYQDSVEFINENWAPTLGLDMMVFQTPYDLNQAKINAMRTAMEKAKDQNIRVVLWVHSLLNTFCGGFQGAPLYDATTYSAWNTKLSQLSTGLGAKARSAIYAILVLDDMNGFASSFGINCWSAAPGQPSPVQQSLVLVAANFPNVLYRGHVWQVGGWASKPVGQKNPQLLTGSTMLFPYTYPTSPPVPPRSGLCVFNSAANTLTPGSMESKLRDDFKGFGDFLKQNPPHGNTPVMVIPPIMHRGLKRDAQQDYSIACSLKSFWKHMRMSAALDPAGWAGQVAGFLPYTFKTFNGTGGPFAGYSATGAEDSPELQEGMRYWADYGSSPFIAKSQFLQNPAQGVWRWRYQECTLVGGGTLQSCVDMPTLTGDLRSRKKWVGSDTTSYIVKEASYPPSSSSRVVARSWPVPFKGTARIRSKFRDGDSSCAGSDGVSIAIYKNNTSRIWPTSGWQTLPPKGRSDKIDLSVSVNAGDVIRFLVHRGASHNTCDLTKDATRIDFDY